MLRCGGAVTRSGRHAVGDWTKTEEEESNDVAKVFLGRPTRSRRFNEVEVEDNFMAISGIIPEDSPYHVPTMRKRE